jgi:hypothetical protein
MALVAWGIAGCGSNGPEEGMYTGDIENSPAKKMELLINSGKGPFGKKLPPLSGGGDKVNVGKSRRR